MNEVEAKLIQYVADNGGEVSYTTVKGVVQDVHITPPHARGLTESDKDGKGADRWV